ncbi:uncharacterized protein SPPG_09171 [Spizellomyces punctatus DAOM BR117]|uniref:Senescence domain-containing protein n=1 Tax=Spizellomyces punctatus (strain DAOM BR117) TaxID=645134 RepID=A0A0L0HJG8_SPIPD|nr:uncharacterized protein SPPG_09171 [Spizellomyces punctatus DAOM BR117]KND00984.1 hypothetical protein SPPG_09171 [Spizellomyces punctatus DAOM BR117]|eukprot:XP_016609023.1 hypothetical protein SPPG_09171 [Spizellomyces punctatus DAOM BR117]
MASSAISFPGATCTVISSAGGAPKSLGTGSLRVTQDLSLASTVLSTQTWSLTIPPTAPLTKLSNGIYLVHLPPTSKLDTTAAAGASPYVFPNDGATLRIELGPKYDSDSVALLEALFADDSPGPQRHPSEQPRNSLALVDEHGQVVGVVAEGLEMEGQGDALPAYNKDEAVVIELSSLPTVPLPGDEQQEETLPVRVKVLRDASSGMLSTSEYISSGLILTSSALGKVMKSGAQSLKTLIPVAAAPWEPDATTKKNIEKVHNASKSTADFTRRAAETVATVAVSAGKTVASSASKLVPGSNHIGDSRTGSASWDLLRTTVHAVGNVLDAGVHAGKTLFDDTVEAASGLVQHRYGGEAGNAVRLSLGAVGNVGLVYFDARGIGRRALLKHVAKGVVMNVRLTDGRVVSLGQNTSEPSRVSGQVPVVSAKVHPQNSCSSTKK